MSHILSLWYGRHRVLFWVITSLIVLYTLAGFVVTPLMVQRVLGNQVSVALQRKVRATRVTFNPFTFSMRIAELSISDRDGSPFVQIGNLSINLDPLISLFKWGVAIQTIQISTPRVRVIRTGQDQFNFSDLLPPSQIEDPKNTSPESKSLRLVLGKFKLTGGQIQYSDRTLSKPFESTVSDLAMTLSGLDTQPEAEAFSYHLGGRTEANELLQVDGRADNQPLSAEADVALKSLALAKYAPYYLSYLNAKVTDGRMDLRAKLHWSEHNRKMGDLLVAITGLALKDSSETETLATVPDFRIEGAAIDLTDRRIQLGRIDSKDARVHIQRNAQGLLNLQAAFAPRAAGQSKPQVPKTEPDKTAPALAWQILVPELNLKNYTMDVEDLQVAPQVRINLHQIDLTAQNLSTREQSQGKVNLQMQWSDKGTLSAKGDVNLVPLQGTLDVTAQTVDIRPLQPYLREFVQMVVTKGEFNTQGQLKIEPKAASTDIKFTGQASLTDFEAVDAEKAALFSKWKSLFLKGIDVSTAPLRVRIDEVALTDFFNRFVIDADGTANIETIIGRQRRVDTAQKPADRPPPVSQTSKADIKPAGAQETDIRIKSVTLQGGKVDFSDLHVKPNVQLVMKDLGGRISGLDNIKEDKADVLLRGMVGGNAPLEIKGQVNPLIEKPFVDLNLTFPGIDLSPFGPYSGRYLGYALEKGQLAFTLSYKVIDNKLVGQNKIKINQLTFGDSVTSPQATKLPVKLAVALLKDRQGNIDLDLPVKGDLDDPEFSMSGIILKMFVNLITDIVSAPFKMLGALFGGGEELSYLAFDPGQSRIAPGRMKKLNTLAKILFERPGLKLEIQGQVEPQKDTDGLRQLRFEENLKATKLKALVAAGRNAVPLDQIEISTPERDAMIQKAFDAATFPKPRDEKGQLKKLSPPEMEKLLYTAITISADDLRQLAYQRASAAKEYLLATGQIDGGRLFVTEPIVEGRQAQKDLKPQVQFNLK